MSNETFQLEKEALEAQLATNRETRNRLFWPLSGLISITPALG